MKAVNEATRMVWRRCSLVKPCVKWMKNGTTPIGLTMASRAIRGLSRSIAGLWPEPGAPAIDVTVDFAAVLDAQRQIRRAKEELVRARVLQQQRLADIERVIGEDL